MTIFRRGEDPATLALTVIAILTMGISLGVLLLADRPDVRKAEQAGKRRQFQVRLLNDKANQNVASKQASIVSQTWNMPEQQVGPVALANVTRLVAKNRLNLISLRPQRRSDDAVFVQLPYLLTVEGSYLQVLALCRELENPANRLAMNLVQIASADASSDKVTASIGLVAYLTPKEAPKNG
jgi:Tfp pilus assembly protein PilO